MSIPSPFEFIPPQFHLASLFIVSAIQCNAKQQFFMCDSFSCLKFTLKMNTTKLKHHNIIIWNSLSHHITWQVGVAGFFIVIGFTSAKPITKSVTIKEDPDGGESIVSEYPTHDTAPSTPVKKEEEEASTPVKKEEIASDSANDSASESASPSTPVGTPKKPPTKSSNQYGSVATPSGRRSARIAQKKPSPKKPSKY